MNPSITVPVMLRPVGSACQLACVDCYTGSGPTQAALIMQPEVLREALSQVKRWSVDHVIGFQGGEPLLAGKQWYRDLIRMAGELALDPVFWIQTNGLLLDEEWLRIFETGSWSVGISYNGQNSAIRPTASSEELDRLADWTERAGCRGVDVSVLCVVDDRTVGDPDAVQEQIRRISNVYSFLPARRSKHAPGPKDYSWFLGWMMDNAQEGDTIGNLENARAQWQGVNSDCQFAPWCHTSAVIDWNGDLYACEWYMEPQHLLGNVCSDNIMEHVFEAEKVTTKRRRSARILPDCLGCQAEGGCYGGCLVDLDQDDRNTYCEALKRVSMEATP